MKMDRLKEMENCLYGIWFNMKIVQKADEIDKRIIRENIRLYLEKADQLGISFSIQNKVLAQAEAQKDFYGAFWLSLKDMLGERDSSVRVEYR